MWSSLPLIIEHDMSNSVGEKNLQIINTGHTFETIDPRNGEVIANIAEGRTEDVDLAVKVARQAFDHGPWPRLPGCVSFSFKYT